MIPSYALRIRQCGFSHLCDFSSLFSQVLKGVLIHIISLYFAPTFHTSPSPSPNTQNKTYLEHHTAHGYFLLTI